MRKIKDFLTLNDLAKFYIEYTIYMKLFVRKEIMKK